VELLPFPGLRKLELVIKERKLRWLGHVLRMEDSKIPRQATVGTDGLQEEVVRTAKEKLDGHVRRDLKDMGITWDEAEELATDRAEWRHCVAQCIHLDAGLSEV